MEPIAVETEQAVTGAEHSSQNHTHLELDDHLNEEFLVEEFLIEEISIDGMCGVY